MWKLHVCQDAIQASFLLLLQRSKSSRWREVCSRSNVCSCYLFWNNAQIKVDLPTADVMQQTVFNPCRHNCFLLLYSYYATAQMVCSGGFFSSLFTSLLIMTLCSVRWSSATRTAVKEESRAQALHAWPKVIPCFNLTVLQIIMSMNLWTVPLAPCCFSNLFANLNQHLSGIIGK